MPKFKVTLERMVSEYAVVYVEAESREALNTVLDDEAEFERIEGNAHWRGGDYTELADVNDIEEVE